MRVHFTPTAWAGYLHGAKDPDMLARINELIEAIRRQPFQGIGKPEPLRGTLQGFWSRRITREHRLVYIVTGAGDAPSASIIQCRYHY